MKARGPRRMKRPQQGGIISSLVSLLFVVVLCGVVYLARYPILRFAGEGWVIDDPIARADAIVVLSDDNFYADRATRATLLYRQGMAPVVVASGRRLRPYAGIAELMEHDLIERGVPKDKIVRFAHDADNTKDEARALAQFSAQRKWRSVIVVTSNYHTRRARYIFTHVFPAGTAIRVTGAPDGDFDPERWWQKRISIKELTRELAGMVVALWELREKDRVSLATPSLVGWNAAKPQLMV
jgi:uncharacterized SAM-binding protein YcdF (DUF218 family)